MATTKRFLILLFIFISTFSTAQPSIQWQKCFGGTLNDGANSIEQTNDGGYVIAGWSSSNDSNVTGHHGINKYDFWIVKVDSNAIIQWQKSLGGSEDDVAWSIQQTSDGGYIVAGASESSDGDVTGHHGTTNSDYWVVKLNNSGNMQWQKSLGGSQIDDASSIRQTSDGGYIVAGRTGSNNGDVTGNHGSGDFWIVKLDTAGIIQWQKCYGGTLFDDARSIAPTEDGGYIVTGPTQSNDGDVLGNHGVDDFWLVKLDFMGVIQWQKCFGGTYDEISYSVQQTTDGGYIICGYASSIDGQVTGGHFFSRDYWVVKTDYLGQLQWQKALGGSGSERAFSIHQTTDGGFITAGVTNSHDGDVTGYYIGDDYWLVKLNDTGAVEWEKCLGGTTWDEARCIAQTTDGGYIVSGFTHSNDGDVSGYYGSRDVWVVKLLPDVTGVDEISNPITDLQIAPNPFSQSTYISFALNQSENISVVIYDITGRELKKLFDGKLAPGNHQLQWNLKDGQVVADGVYFLKIVSSGFSRSCRLVVVN